ncbi:MAG: A/G-specific adenine glycosylase [Thermoguttaceae bacterium]|nr:A/G-specific adenine glycosylase [Thermoguttaceae bacterium]
MTSLAKESAAESSPFDFRRARKAALAWFQINGRLFPWRDDPTPYRVWISEIMLQQTTTQTVLGYFERFLKRFPNVDALAAASEEETLKYWEGLGYYRRARSLRAAAIEIAERFDSEFPSNYDDVLSLPGVGRYAAGAILSFGFDKRFPILEANTTRLHARLTGLLEEPTTAASQRLLWKFAEDWLPQESSRRAPGVYRRLNGALTDLGRLVCAPVEPRCDVCPLATQCAANRLGLQEKIPALKKKAEPIRRVDVATLIFRSDLKRADFVGETSDATRRAPSDVLLIRRTRRSLWAGLWDFPRFEVVDSRFADARDFSKDASLAERLQYFLEDEVGAPPSDYRVGKAITTTRHSVTRYRVTLRVCQLVGSARKLAESEEKTLFDSLVDAAPRPTRREQVARPLRQADELRWVPLASLSDYPLSSPGRRVADWLAKSAAKQNF